MPKEANNESITMSLLSLAADGMAPKLLRLISAYYASTKVKARANGGDSVFLAFPSGIRQECVLTPTNVAYMVDWYLGPALQVSPGIQVGTSVHVSDLFCVLKLRRLS